jgi:hypothetical protein
MLDSAPPPALAALSLGDRVGVFASGLCAVHCASLPLLSASLPALGLSLGGFGDLDQAFVLFASMLGISTVTLGYRRHRVLKAAWLLVAGLLMLWVGSFTSLHDHGLGHALVMTLGGVLLALAHFYNLRLTHRRAPMEVSGRR